MKFVEMKDGVPGDKMKKHLKLYIDEFINMGVKVARVDIDEHDYKNVKVAYRVLYNHIKRFGHPINVVMRKGEIYFVRKDI